MILFATMTEDHLARPPMTQGWAVGWAVIEGGVGCILEWNGRGRVGSAYNPRIYLGDIAML